MAIICQIFLLWMFLQLKMQPTQSVKIHGNAKWSYINDYHIYYFGFGQMSMCRDIFKFWQCSLIKDAILDITSPMNSFFIERTYIES